MFAMVFFTSWPWLQVFDDIKKERPFQIWNFRTLFLQTLQVPFFRSNLRSLSSNFCVFIYMKFTSDLQKTVSHNPCSLSTMDAPSDFTPCLCIALHVVSPTGPLKNWNNQHQPTTTHPFPPWFLQRKRPTKSSTKVGKNSSDFTNSENYVGVSNNRCTPKSSILIGFSIIDHPFWGTPIFGNTHVEYLYEWKRQKIFQMYPAFSKQYILGEIFPKHTHVPKWKNLLSKFSTTQIPIKPKKNCPTSNSSNFVRKVSRISWIKSHNLFPDFKHSLNKLFSVTL